MMPTVSIIVAAYNAAKTIQCCLDSVAQQMYREWEIICIDDASTDATPTILHQWQQNHPQTQMNIVHNTKNQGLTHSLARGTQEARGKLLARLDADDWWAAEKLERQVRFLNAHPTHGIIGSWYANVRPHGMTTVRVPITDRDIRSSIFWRNPFGHSCVLMRKEVFGAAGGYDTTLRFGQDRDLWFRMLPITRMANIPEVLCYRTVNTTSTTNTRAQIRQQFKTVHKYARRYRASPLVYLSFIEPSVVYLLPKPLRLRARAAYDRILTH